MVSRHAPGWARTGVGWVMLTRMVGQLSGAHGVRGVRGAVPPCWEWCGGALTRWARLVACISRACTTPPLRMPACTYTVVDPLLDGTCADLCCPVVVTLLAAVLALPHYTYTSAWYCVPSLSPNRTCCLACDSVSSSCGPVLAANRPQQLPCNLDKVQQRAWGPAVMAQARTSQHDLHKRSRG